MITFMKEYTIEKLPIELSILKKNNSITWDISQSYKDLKMNACSWAERGQIKVLTIKQIMLGQDHPIGKSEEKDIKMRKMIN